MFKENSRSPFPLVLLNSEYSIGFTSNALGCILYGIYITIAGANVFLLHKRGYRILLSFTLFQLVVTTFYMAISLYSKPTQLLSIFGLFDVNTFVSVSLWNNLARDASFLINTWVSDAFLLYRCHVIWKGNKYAVAFPVLIYLATVGASVAWLIVDSVPGAVNSTHNVQVAGAAVFSCSAAMNIAASGLISGRLLFYRRAISQAAGSQQGRLYLGYIALTLESAALYTVFVILTMATFLTSSPLQALFFDMLAIVQVIAPSLIVYRIANGTSFEATDRNTSRRSTSAFRSSLGVPRKQASAHDVLDVSRTLQLPADHNIKLDLSEFGHELGELEVKHA